MWLVYSVVNGSFIQSQGSAQLHWRENVVIQRSCESCSQSKQYVTLHILHFLYYVNIAFDVFLSKCLSSAQLHILQ